MSGQVVKVESNDICLIWSSKNELIEVAGQPGKPSKFLKFVWERK